MNKHFYIIFLSVIFSTKIIASIFNVGQGKTYSTPNALYIANVIKDGDTIYIFQGKYIGNDALAVWSKNNLNIIGKEGRPILEAAGKYIFGKGIWVISGNNCNVQNIEFSGAKVPDQNGAGIRVDGAGITVRQCNFHHNENGMLITPATLGDVLVEYSEFAYNGYGDGYSHNIYVNNTNHFTFQYNYSHHADIGHCVKSRARINTILYNRIMDEADGNSSRLIDLSNGGKCNIHSNVMHQGVNAENFNAIGIGLEGLTEGIAHSVNFSFNTIINERKNSCLFLSIHKSITQVEASNNIYGGECTISDNVVINSSLGNIINSKIDALFFLNAAKYDYHLTSNSPGINKASTPISTPIMFQPVDEYVYNSKKRTRNKIGSAFDIGAFEYEGPTSTKEIANSIVVYPNPVWDYLFSNQEKDQKYIIYNEERIVLSGNNLSKVDVSMLPTGIYFFHLENKKPVKFIKL